MLLDTTYVDFARDEDKTHGFVSKFWWQRKVVELASTSLRKRYRTDLHDPLAILYIRLPGLKRFSLSSVNRSAGLIFNPHIFLAEDGFSKKL